MSHTADQVKDGLLIRLKVKVGLFLASAQAVPLLPMDSSTLLQEIQSLVHTLIRAEFGVLQTDVVSKMLTEIEKFHGVAEPPTYALTFEDGSVASRMSSLVDSSATSYAPSIFDHARSALRPAGSSDISSMSGFETFRGMANWNPLRPLIRQSRIPTMPLQSKARANLFMPADTASRSASRSSKLEETVAEDNADK